MRIMQAVILAAGRGTRMNELTLDCPKPMLPLLGKPLLAWKVEMLPKDIDEVIFVVGYLGNYIREYFGDEWQGRKMSYVEQKLLNGTAGATALVKNMITGPVLVTMGDDLYTTQDLENLMKEKAALLVYNSNDAMRFGLIESTENGYLKGVKERPHGMQTGFVCTNGILLPMEYFDVPMVPVSDTEFGLPQTLSQMAKNEPVKLVTAIDWQPIGQPEDIPLGEDFLRKYSNI